MMGGEQARPAVYLVNLTALLRGNLGPLLPSSSDFFNLAPTGRSRHAIFSATTSALAPAPRLTLGGWRSPPSRCDRGNHRVRATATSTRTHVAAVAARHAL